MPVYDPTIWDNENAEFLLDAVAMVKNRSQAKAVLADLLTDAEIQELGNRMKAAQLLRSGQTYDQVRAATGMSTATIAKISSWLKEGAGGYNLVFSELENQERQQDTLL